MKGHRLYGPLFLLLVAVAALVLVGRAAGGIWGYLRLDQEAPAHVERWEIEQVGTDAYSLVAHYSFDYRGEQREGSSRWAGKRFPNRLAAEAKMVRLRGAPVRVYFSAGRPDSAVLNRTFPLKRAIYALIGVGVALYFAVLAFLVRSSKNHASI